MNAPAARPPAARDRAARGARGADRGAEGALRRALLDRAGGARAARPRRIAVRRAAARGGGLLPRAPQDVADAVKLAERARVPVIPFGVGSSLEGHLLAVQGGISIDLSPHEPGARGQRRGPHGDGAARRHAQAAQRRDQEHRPVLPDRPRRRRLDRRHGATRASGTNAVRYGTMRENVLALEVVTASGEVIRTGTRAQEVSGRLRPDAADRRQRRHAGRDHRDHAAHLPAARGDVGGDLLLPEHRGGGAHDDPDHPAGRADRARASCSTQRGAHGQRHDKLALREEPMLLMEFHGTPAGVKEQAETVQELASEHGGKAFEWATHARGAHAALDRAAQRLLRRPSSRRPAAALITTDTCVPISRLADCLLDSVAEADASGHPLLPRRPRRRRQLPLRLPARPEHARGARDRRAAQPRAGAARAARWTAPAPASTASACTRWTSWSSEAGAGAIDMMRTIKRALDPKNIMNPGQDLRALRGADLARQHVLAQQLLARRDPDVVVRRGDDAPDEIGLEPGAAVELRLLARAPARPAPRPIRRSSDRGESRSARARPPSGWRRQAAPACRPRSTRPRPGC